MKTLIKALLCAAFLTMSAATAHAQTSPTPPPAPTTPTEDYLSWNAKQAVDIGKAWRASGRVGGALDMRVLHTEHSYNYKLRATLMTPEAIRAAARLRQLRGHLSDEQTRTLVTRRRLPANWSSWSNSMPVKASGVIPLDWRASLRPKSAEARCEHLHHRHEQALAAPCQSARGRRSPRLLL